MVAKFRAIKPRPINDKAMSAELRDSMKEASKFAIKDFENVTTGWSGERPRWQAEYWANQYQIGFKIFSDPNSEGSLKWRWLDLGTKKNYPIPTTPKPPGQWLAFPSVYNAGSAPNRIRTYGSSSGGETVFAKQVIHPGIEARNWTKILQRDDQKMFASWMAPGMTKAARASGHGVR